MTIQEAKKLIRKAHFSADKPLDSLDLAVEKIYAELFGITEQMEAELKAKDERIEAQSSVIIACQNTILQKDERIIELEARIQNMCAECERAKFADNAIKPSEMWKLHLALKDNK